jgi:TetR/AcrR family transcriptional regulator, transcriptional repressor of aconitase
MPKIVDHDAYRLELAGRAIGVFRRLGYHGLGMRQIADEIGVSKSALYHYFAGKKALFDVCSRLVTEAPPPPLPPNPSVDERFAALVAFGESLDRDFLGELSLLVDYLRPLSRDEVRGDETLARARAAFEASLARLVGPARAAAALHQLLGILLLRQLDGGTTDFESLRPFVAPDRGASPE